MRIVHVMLSRAPQTGKRFYNTVIGLAALGEEVSVVTHPKAEINERLKALPLSQLGLRAPFGERDTAAAARLGPLLRTLRADMVICHDALALTLVRRATGNELPLLALDDGEGSWPLLADGALISTRSRLASLEAANILPERLYHMPPMADAPGGFIRPLWKPTVQLLVQAPLDEQGGIPVFFEALAQLRKEGMECHATVLAEGLRMLTLRRLLRPLGLQDAVTFTLPPADISDALKKADIFCHPALEATDGGLFLPAMAAKLPILATHTEASGEVLTEDLEAVLVPAGDARALASGLRRLLEDEDSARTLASNAFHRLRMYHSRERIFRYVLEVLQHAAQCHAIDRAQAQAAPELMPEVA